MTDSLAHRVADRQVEMYVKDVARDAAQLAETAANYAAGVKSGGPYSGGANRLVQQAAQLAQLASRIDGMREIASLLPGPDKGDR